MVTTGGTLRMKWGAKDGLVDLPYTPWVENALHNLHAFQEP